MYNHRWNGYLDEVAATSDEETYKYVLADIKGIFDRKEAEDMNYLYWRL